MDSGNCSYDAITAGNFLPAAAVGFRYFDDRDLIGVVDGTEYPTARTASGPNQRSSRCSISAISCSSVGDRS